MNTTKPTELVVRQTKLFCEFRALSIKAQKTLEMDDAIAAGNAWRAYVHDFLSIEAQDKLETIKFPNRGARL